MRRGRCRPADTRRYRPLLAEGVTMARRRNAGLFEELSVAVAMGATVKSWATDHGVPESTARHWSALPEFKARVAGHRRRLTARELELHAQHSFARQAARTDPTALRAVFPCDGPPRAE